MRQVVYALTGSEIKPPILDRLIERFAERVRDDIEDIVWSANFLGISEAEKLFSRFRAMGPPDQASLCLDPVVFNAVCAAKSNTCVDTVTHLTNTVSVTRSNLGNHDGFWIGGTIQVDLGSDYCATVDPTSPVFLRPMESLTAEERRAVEHKLAGAIAEIDATSAVFGRLIRNYTRKIFCRKIEGMVPASEQVDTELGAIRLRNVHSDIYTHDQLVDDLIHESTHGFLGAFEYVNYPFNPYGFQAERWVRPVSPWSMRSIQVLPFVHACFGKRLADPVGVKIPRHEVFELGERPAVCEALERLR